MIAAAEEGVVVGVAALGENDVGEIERISENLPGGFEIHGPYPPEFLREDSRVGLLDFWPHLRKILSPLLHRALIVRPEVLDLDQHQACPRKGRKRIGQAR